jgi:hypothetical protein
MRISLPRPLTVLLGGLLLINLLQAFSTELIFDEAYYWYYARNPAWGYFDHPPMVAWMIALGTWLVDNELGVRLISCFMGVGTFLFLWSLSGHPKKSSYLREFFVWVLSITLLQAYGFLSLPDTPLLFFTALFLWLYKRFLSHPGLGIAVLLGISMAALMYSKYHAALVILFVLLSNLSLLKNRYAWVALVVSLLSYLPHLNWLYQNDFISVRFHLFERPNQPYDFAKFTLGFFVNMVALFGLTFPWVYRTLFRFHPRDTFEKALKYLALGVLLFFFLSSFQRRIQTQWLVVICIPVAVMVGRSLMDEPGLRKWIWRMGLANILILLWLRVGLVYEPLFPGTFESHGNKVWVANLQKVADGNPVVFENSYRLASMYGYYSREPSIALNNAYYRKNQFSIDQSEALVQGKKVFYSPKGRKKGDLSYLDHDGTPRYGYFMENFESFRKLEAGISHDKPLNPEGVYQMWVYNPYDTDIPLSKLRFGVAYLDAYKRLGKIQGVQRHNPVEGMLSSRDTLRFEFTMPGPAKSSPVYARAVISENQLLWGLNGLAQPIDP